LAIIGGAVLWVGLWPLLSRGFPVSQARLTVLELNLARDARGRNNWQDLGAGGEAAQADTSVGDGAGANLDLGIGAIEIVDARVTWNDAAAGSRWELTDFGLEANGFGPGRQFPLRMQFALSGADVAVKVDARMQATLALAANEYRLEQLAVTLEGSGAGWPGGQGEAALTFDSFVANLGNETLELGGLSLDFLGITMAGSLSGQNLFSNLALTGAVDIRQFDPSAVLEELGVNVQTADSAVLKRASAKANLLYNSRQVGLRELQFALDDSQLTGNVRLEGEQLRYELTVNDINIDRYLPPAEDGAVEDEGSLDEVDLPLAVLRTLNARGDLKFGRAQFSGLTLTNAAFSLNAANGAVRLVPSATLYGGKYSGDIDIRVQADAAQMALKQTLDDVDLAALGQDLLGSQDVTGTGDVTLNLVATGSNLGQMRRELDGDVAFAVTNGSLEGIDLWYELRRARARLDNVDIPARGTAARRTTFSSLSASGVVENALLTNKDLNGRLDFMSISGSGTVNLLDDALNFDLTARFVDGETLQSDPEMAKLAGAAVPLRVTGTIDAPSVLPDFGAIVRARVTQEVNERVDEKREEVREEVRDRLRDRLRGVLER
jgi:AsmA protein